MQPAAHQLSCLNLEHSHPVNTDSGVQVHLQNFWFIVTSDFSYTVTLLVFLALLKLKIVENSDPHNFVEEEIILFAM